MTVDDARPPMAVIGTRELAGVFIALGTLLLVQWVLSLWQLASPVSAVWSAVLWRDLAAFTAINIVTYVMAKTSTERWVLAAFGFSVFIVAFELHGGDGDLFDRILWSARWLALFGLCALAYQAPRPGGIKIFLVAICFWLFVPISIAYLDLTYLIRPQTLDWFAYSFDLSLGAGVVPYFFILFHRSYSVAIIASVAYVSLLGAYEVLFSLQLRFLDRSVVPALRVFLIAAVLGFACYFIFPVVGPAHFFGDSYPSRLPGFTDFVPALAPAMVTARNGMPSLHFAWALLLVVNVPRELRYAKAAFALFCFLTLLATLGLGEHFFADLLAALPFAATVQAIGLSLSCGGNPRFSGSALRSGAIFAGFLSLLALSPAWLQMPAVSWSITALLVSHFVLEMRWQRSVWTSAELRALTPARERAAQ